MARLELARNSWWTKMTYDEQVQYLKDHPRSRLKVTRRRPRRKKEEAPAEPQEEQVQEGVQPADTPEERQEILDAVINNTGTVELNDDEKEIAAGVMQEQVADLLAPESVSEKIDDETKQEIEEELEEVIDIEDKSERTRRFLTTALKVAVKVGIITAAVALTGSTGATVLFVPSVITSIWDTATDWSDRSEPVFDTAINAVYNVLKRDGGRKHIKYGVRKPTANDGDEE